MGIEKRGTSPILLKPDPSTPINPVKPTAGRKLTEEYLKKLKDKKK